MPGTPGPSGPSCAHSVSTQHVRPGEGAEEAAQSPPRQRDSPRRGPGLRLWLFLFVCLLFNKTRDMELVTFQELSQAVEFIILTKTGISKQQGFGF